MRLIYRPKHPKANKNGMVDANQVFESVAGSAPNVISDIMAPTRHMGTGEMFTSKRAFSQRTKDIGCVEYGNDKSLEPRQRKLIPMDRAKRRDDIRRTIAELQGRR